MPKLYAAARSTNRRRRAGRRAAVAAVACAVLLLAGCGDKTNEPFRDAPRGATNDEPADVITMPDGFSNIASKCHGLNRVFVIYHGDSPYGAIAVAPDDPSCR